MEVMSQDAVGGEVTGAPGGAIVEDPVQGFGPGGQPRTAPIAIGYNTPRLTLTAEHRRAVDLLSSGVVTNPSERPGDFVEAAGPVETDPRSAALTLASPDFAVAPGHNDLPHLCKSTEAAAGVCEALHAGSPKSPHLTGCKRPRGMDSTRQRAAVEDGAQGSIAPGPEQVGGQKEAKH